MGKKWWFFREQSQNFFKKHTWTFCRKSKCEIFGFLGAEIWRGEEFFLGEGGR
jgi:hypothetical protein